jgi:hypothetical protein
MRLQLLYEVIPLQLELGLGASQSCIAAYASDIVTHPNPSPRDRQEPRLLPSCILRYVDHCGPQRIDDTTGWRVDPNP